MDTAEAIQDFLRGDTFAVVGASSDRAKYGNMVLRCYLQNGKRAFPVHGVSIITPPPVTERVVEDAAAAGITRVWMQPGAESQRAIDRARELGLTVIAGGPCVLVSLGFHDR